MASFYDPYTTPRLQSYAGAAPNNPFNPPASATSTDVAMQPKQAAPSQNLSPNLQPAQESNYGNTEAGRGRFVNFGRLMGLNRDKANSMVQRLADPIQQQGNQLRTGIGNVKNEFSGAVNAGVTPNSFTTPGTYAGPQGAAAYPAYQGLQQNNEQLQRNLALTQTAGGVSSLLRPGGKGAGRLDTGLTQAAGQGAFQSLRDRYGKLGDTLKSAMAGSQEEVKGAQKQAGEQGKAVKQYEADVAKRGEAQKTWMEQKANARKTGDQSGIDEAAYAQAYGLTPEQYKRAFEPDLSTLTEEQLRNLRQG